MESRDVTRLEDFERAAKGLDPSQRQQLAEAVALLASGIQAMVELKGTPYVAALLIDLGEGYVREWTARQN